MRPRGEIRSVLASTADEWARTHIDAEGQPQGVTWRQLAELACVGYALARATVKNMVTAGELVPAGMVSVPGSRRRMAAYVPARLQREAPANLGDVLRGWAA